MILFKYFILGTITALLFPPFFMLPLGFVIFPYFVKITFQLFKIKSLLNYFFSGFFFALGFFLIFLSWIYNPFFIDESTKPFAFLGFLLPILLSIFFGLCFLIYKLIKGFFYYIFLTPLIFSLAEYLISNLFTGFPWFTNSLILSSNFIGLIIIKKIGTLPSSYLVILIFLLPIFILGSKNIYRIKFLLLLHFPFFIILFLPIDYFFSNNNKNIKELKIQINQLVVPLNETDKNNIQKNILKIVEKSSSDLIIFAENNYPFVVSDFKNLNIYPEQDKKVIIGATRVEDDKYYNSFLFIEENNLKYFDKKILVPFGEFLPFRKYLKFMEIISGSNDFEVGSQERLIVTKDNLNILPIICYEIIFDKIYSEINKNNIDVLINITNDSWFGNKIGPYQHLYLTKIKSVIANRPLIRVSNNGISAFINNGNILEYIKLNKKDIINYKLKINNTYNFANIHNLFLVYLLFLLLINIFFSRYVSVTKK